MYCCLWEPLNIVRGSQGDDGAFVPSFPMAAISEISMLKQHKDSNVTPLGLSFSKTLQPMLLSANVSMLGIAVSTLLLLTQHVTQKTCHEVVTANPSFRTPRFPSNSLKLLYKTHKVYPVCSFTVTEAPMKFILWEVGNSRRAVTALFFCCCIHSFQHSRVGTLHQKFQRAHRRSRRQLGDMLPLGTQLRHRLRISGEDAFQLLRLGPF